MDERKTKEIESIKALITLLARKGYILKSELESILTGCRCNAFVLNDLEKLMQECIGEDIDYIDDCGASLVHIALEIQEKIKLMGYEDLFTYLELDPDASDEEILIALKKKKNWECDDNVRFLIDHNGRQTYEAILRSKEIMEQLQLRQHFHVSRIRNSEYRSYLNDLILLAFLDEKTAMMVLDGMVSWMAFSVEPDVQQCIEGKERLDAYLVEISEDQDQKRLDNIKDINGFRGINNG